MSTVILARLLTPADFGVVAIAMIVVGLLEMLSQTGQALAIIQHESPTREHYDSAWTISILIGIVIALAIVAIAPLTRYYFHDPRSIVVMQCLAVRAILGGFENVGMIDFRRDLRFDRVFLYTIAGKLFAFCMTVGLAIILRNYWALVAGMISGQLIRTILSYVIHPYRPRPCFREVFGIWSFSIWTFIRAVGNYLSSQVDHIAVGGISGAASMGRYAVASDVASSPSYEIIDPMVAVLYPVMARLQGRPEQLRQLYLRTLGWSAIICTSASVGVSLVAPEMVRLVLGRKWLDVIPLVPWLALAAGLNGLRSGAYSVLDAIGLPHVGARLQWFRVLTLALTIFPVAYATHDLLAIAKTQLATMAVFIPSLFIAVGHRVGVTPYDYGRALWRAVAAAAIMALIVTYANLLLPLAGNAKLAFDVAVGATTYFFSIIALWLASGRPPSPEQDLLSRLWLRKANA